MAGRKLKLELDVAKLALVFKAIADPTRQRILALLEDRARPVGEIVDAFSLAQPTISRHLSVLKNAGLVQAERRGKHVIYSLCGSELRSLCCGFFGAFQCCSDLLHTDEGGEE